MKPKCEWRNCEHDATARIQRRIICQQCINMVAAQTKMIVMSACQ